MEKTDRVKTGIPGFDKIVQGGFIRESVYLVSGGGGTGQSIFAMQFLYNGFKEYGEKGLYISFEEDIEDLKADGAAFGWDFNKLDKEGKVKFIYLYPYEINNFQAQLANEITRIKAQRVVVDSTSAFGISLDNDYEVRKELYALASQLKRLKCTSILTSEVVGETSLEGQSIGKLSRFDVEEFVVDCVITLHYLGLGGLEDRAIRVVKMRRTNHKKGPISMKITDKGITVKSK